jgi:apolipoprotein N-acyltransferase
MHKRLTFLQDWRGDMLALVAGALLPLTFAPLRLGWLAPLLLACLFATWLEVSPRRVLLRGWLFASAMFMAGVYWLYTSMHVFGYVPPFIAVLFVILFSVSLALLPAFAGYMARRWFYNGPAQYLVVVIPLCWALMEWVRGWFLTGFPWLGIGYSQTGMPLQGFAPILGVHAVSLLTAMSAALMVYIVMSSRISRALGVSALLLMWVAGALLDRIEWTSPAGKALTVSLVQGNVDQHRKWRPDYRNGIIDNYLKLTRWHWNSDIIIWPETAVPAFYRNVAKSRMLPLAVEARQHKTDMLIGVPVKGKGRTYYNSVVTLGSEIGFYHKRHLVPFGEYVPLRKYLKNLLAIMRAPMAGFVPGDSDQKLVKLAGYPVAVAVCYEIVFGSEVARDLPQAAFIVNVSNNAWFGRSGAAHQQLQMGQMRARELERYVLSDTNDGVTAIVDDRGRVVKELPRFQVGVLTGKVVPRQGATPYARWRDWPIMVLIVVALGLVRLRRRG